jgi:hypothetical protein
MFIANLFNLSKAEMAEYNAAKTIDELAEIIIQDGKNKGCVLVANADMKADAELVAKIEKSEVMV